LIFLISLLMITKVDLMKVFTNTQTDMMTQLSLAVLFTALYQMYVIVARSFFGKTLGEWTFDHQLGRKKEQDSALYPIQVLWRSFLTVITGVFILPTLSFISRKDIPSYLSGLQLYKKRQ